MQKSWGVIAIIAVLAIIGFGIYFSAKGSGNSKNENKNTDTAKSDDTIVDGAIATLFYSQSCHYCAEVNQWLTDNKVAEKIKFDKREVSNNKDNSQLFNEKAKVCGIAEEEVGVPFLFDSINNKCYFGRDEVINFFKSKL